MYRYIYNLHRYIIKNGIFKILFIPSFWRLFG